MQTPRASHKLHEAQFFLWHLKEEDRKIMKQWAEAFGYYLSAFLNAAQSIIYILHEHEAKGTFKEHYRKWRETLPPEDREFLNRMMDRRAREVHALGAETLPTVRMVPAELVPGVQVFGPPAALGCWGATEHKTGLRKTSDPKVPNHLPF